MQFSPVSEFIVLFLLSSPFWHMLLIQRESNNSTARQVVILGIVAIWSVFAYASVRYDFDKILLGDFPARPLLYILIASSLCYFFRNTILGDGVSQQKLIGIQLMRILGLVFVFEWLRGTLPGWFAHPAGWGDLAAGSTALLVLAIYAQKKIPHKAIKWVAGVGLTDFFFALFFGFTTADNPAQLFSHDQPNQVLLYPLGLIPLFLVPYLVAAHILSLTQMRRSQNLNQVPAFKVNTEIA